MAKKKTHEQFCLDLYEKTGGEFVVKELYIGSRERILFQHVACGTEFYQTPHRILSKSHKGSATIGSCPNPECTAKKKELTRKANQANQTQEDRELKAIAGTEARKKTCLEKYGYEFASQVPEFKEKMKETSLKKYGVDNPAKSDKVREKIIKTNQEKYGAPTWAQSGKGEEAIQILSDKNLFSNFLKEMKDPNPETIAEAFGYTPGTIREYLAKYQLYHLCTSKGGCSIAECEIFEWLRTLIPDLVQATRILDGKEIDIYSPFKKIGIEYNGIVTHASDYDVTNFFGVKNRDYHLLKTQAAAKLGIRLIHIFEDEYLLNKDLIKNKIAAIFGVSTQERVFARQTTAREIDFQIAKSFLNDYHIQGAPHNFSFAYGLYRDDNLIAVMTFGKNFRSKASNEEGYYELSRFATSKAVIGGFSKLVAYFFKTNDFAKGLYSFADLRWVDKNNNVYLNNNWELDSVLPPDYTYCSTRTYERVHKSRFQKSNIAKVFPSIYDESLTEKQMMSRQREWVVNYDVGKIKYILNRSDDFCIKKIFMV